jgi:glycolate oxidase iron-sulfur subunit
MEGLFSHVNEATARTLAANGYAITRAPGQGCCGALYAHAGEHERAQELARANVAAFAAAAPDAVIAVNSAGCGAALKEYSHLLADDPLAAEAKRFAARVKDVSELLAARGPRPGAPLPLTVAYDPPCHLLHAQRIAREPSAVIDAIPGIRRVSHAEAELCCGSAGIYSLLEPELSRAVLERKIEAIKVAAPDVVATGNPGCAMQIGAGLRAAGLRTPVVHPVELLDHSYRAAGLYDEESAP